MSSNPSLAHDLALKRTVQAPVDQKPHYAWRDVVAAETIAVPPVVLLCPHGEERFVLAEVADTLGKALTNVALAKGEKDIFNDTNRAWVARICREVTANLTELARNQNPLRLSLNALYELIEKTLVDNNAYFIAKSLLLNRARKISVDRESAAQSTLRVIRRNNQVVPWSEQKVEIAVRKTFLSLQRDSAPAVAVTKAVSERVHASKQAFVHIEEVQDMVQEELMKGGFFKVAEAYILFRAERSVARLNGTADESPAAAAAPTAPTQETMIVVKKANGENIFWDGADLRKRIEFARIGLDLCLSNEEIEQELRRAAYDQILQKDLDSTIILNSKTLIEKDADFAKFAGRIQLTYIYEEVLGWDIMRDGIAKLKEFHQRAFKKYLEHGVAIKRLNPRLLDFDLTKLAAALDPSSDLEFDFLGIQTLYDRYLIIDKTKKPARRLETPQFFWIRVAMGLSLDEPTDREGKAAGLYSLYKTRRFCSSTPTLFNAGTLHSQLSSCYLYYVDDSIEGIFQRGISENAYLSKWAGGLGGSWTAVRGTGAYIGGTNGESQGVIPFLKLHNDQLVAINQGGKRKGSGCAYLETWHNDVYEFLELRKNTGDDRRRTHDMNTANWIPDLFMKRMEARGAWTLFRANEVPDLHETFGKKFEERYIAYEKMAEEGKIFGQKVEALDLWKKMLSLIFETGHPWITFKDACNIRSPQDTVDLLEQERGVAVDVPRGGKMDWTSLRAKIAAQGMRNSNVLAIAPTATISNITNTSPCIEPTYKNLFVKSNLSGEFIVLNPFLVKDLKTRGLWDQDMIDNLKYFDGEVKDIDRIPADLKAKYLTAFDIDAKWIVDAAARRQKWIDQAQSVNLWIKTPDLKTLSHMYRHAWHAGLKTTYYLRSLGASNIEKATISVKKEVRGAIKEGRDGGQNSGDAGGTHATEITAPSFAMSGAAPAPAAKKEYTAAEKTACSIEAMRNGGECEACQ